MVEPTGELQLNYIWYKWWIAIPVKYISFIVYYQIHENASIVQQYMLSVNSVIQKALIPVPTLHLTLMVMCLENEEQIQK